MVAWSDGYGSAPHPNIYCARVAQNGFVIDPNGILVCNAFYTQWLPKLHYYLDQFLLVWDDNRFSSNTIFGSRITNEAFVLDPNGFQISDTTASAGYWFRQNTGLSSMDTEIFVVWDQQEEDYSYLRGTKIDSYGNVLNSPALYIRDQDKHSALPILAGEGNNMLLAWADLNDQYYGDIKTSLMSSDGILQDSIGTNIDLMLNTTRDPSIAWDGERFLAVWSDNRQRNGVYDSTAFDIYGRFFTSEGNPDSLAFVINDSVGSQRDPEILFGGTQFFVIWKGLSIYEGWWTDYTKWNIYGCRILPDGTIIDSSHILISSEYADEYDKSNHKIAFDGTNYFVIWTDERQGYLSVWGTRVSQEGIVLDSTNIWVSFASGNAYYPDITFGNQQYLVVW